MRFRTPHPIMFYFQQMYSCGGFEDGGTYLSLCQTYAGKNNPWSSPELAKAAADNIHLNVERGFHSLAVVHKANGDELMLALGGYNYKNGFLNSVEKMEAASKSWTVVRDMKLNESRSHFCSVYYKVNWHVYYLLGYL